MNTPVKVSLILAVAIVIAVGMWIYFSPFPTCLREYSNRRNVVTICVRLLAEAEAYGMMRGIDRSERASRFDRNTPRALRPIGPLVTDPELLEFLDRADQADEKAK